MTEGNEGAPPPGAAELNLGATEAKPAYVAEFVSPDRVVPADRIDNKEQTLIRNAGDATIVINKDSKTVEFYNQRGEKIERPDSDLMIANWEDAKTDFGQLMLVRASSDIPAGSTFHTTLDNLPSALRSAGEALLERGTEVPLPLESWRIDSTDLSKVAIDVQDEAVILSMPGTDSFIAYLRQDESGSPLTAANWRRVDSLTSDISTLPEVVQARLAVRDRTDIRNVAAFIDRSHNDYAVETTDNALIVANIDGSERFREARLKVGNNIAVNPRNEDEFYFCSEEADSIGFINTGTTSMRVTELGLPEEYTDVHNLQIDPDGRFVSFASHDKLVILRFDNGELKPVDTVEGIYHSKIVYPDVAGAPTVISGVNADGQLVTRNVDFGPIDEMIRRQAAEAASAQASAGAMTAEEQADAEQQAREVRYRAAYGTARQAAIDEVQGRLQTMTTFEDIQTERERLDRFLAGLDTNLSASVSDAAERQQILAYYRAGIQQGISVKEREIGRGLATEGLAQFETILKRALSYGSYRSADTILKQLHGELRNYLTDEQRASLRVVESTFAERTSEYRIRQASEIVTRNAKTLEQLHVALAQINNTNLFNDFMAEQEVITLDDGTVIGMASLRALSSMQVFEENASLLIQGREAIQAALKKKREELEDREAVKGSTPEEQRNAKINIQKAEIRDFVRILRDKFTTREQVLAAINPDSESFLSGYQAINEAIAQMDEKAQFELERFMGSSIFMTIFELERAQTAGKDINGRDLVKFGDVLFPRWEDPYKRRKARELGLTFIPSEEKFTYTDPVTGRPKIATLGEIGVKEINGKPDVVVRRAYQGKTDLEGHNVEEDWRYGTAEGLYGGHTPSMHVTNEDFNMIQKDFADWEKGSRSKLRRQEKEKRKHIGEVYKQRPVELGDGSETTLEQVMVLLKEREDLRRAKRKEEAYDEARLTELEALTTIEVDGETKNWKALDDDEWEDKYQAAIDDYASFAAEKHILLFKRIQELRNEPEIQEALKGAGVVPDWNPSWTIDAQTQYYLQEIAELALDQLDSQQGVLALVGHAGTGKDVLIQMFCNLANRKLFTVDGSPFTTEKNLTETQVLVDGTVHTVPSVVLQAVQTPGAVLYFNEYNAMPESTQIVLNALFDGKRSVTLKTSPEKPPIKADPSVLMFLSMNPPQYEGVVKPTMSGITRMEVLPIDYPPLYVDEAKTKYNSADALRIARSVNTLAKYTDDLDLTKNEFVKIWDNRVNAVPNDAPNLTEAEEVFDLGVIFVLVEYTDKLRSDFKKTFDGTTNFAADVNLSLPITSRELAACARKLNRMSWAEKSATTPLALAKELLKQRFTTKLFYDEPERVAIEAKINNPAAASWDIKELLAATP